MSKKGGKNAFMCFVQEFREEQKKKGIIYNHINEVINAADPVWRGSSTEERSRFAKMVENQKKGKSSEKKFTSTGIPLSFIENAERELLERKELERTDIKNMVNSRLVTDNLLTMDIYIMDVNSYCKIDQNYIIGECAVLRFNVKDGIKETYHEMINPGPPPMGYSYEMREGATSLALAVAHDAAPRTNYMQILANVVDYLKMQDRDAVVLPPIFALPEKVQQVHNFILQMCMKAREDESLFRVYKLDLLFFHLMNALKTSPDSGLPRESLATLLLKKDPFKYTSDISCEHHQASDAPTECSLARAKRAAFAVLDSCCAAAALAPAAGRHLPHDYDVPSIESFRERRGKDAASAVFAPPPARQQTDRAADTPRSQDVSSDECGDGGAGAVGGAGAAGGAGGAGAVRGAGQCCAPRRRHVPQRMPADDYSQHMTAPPDLTEDPPAHARHGTHAHAAAGQSLAGLKLQVYFGYKFDPNRESKPQPVRLAR